MSSDRSPLRCGVGQVASKRPTGKHHLTRPGREQAYLCSIENSAEVEYLEIGELSLAGWIEELGEESLCANCLSVAKREERIAAEKAAEEKPLVCPSCGREAERKQAQYGRRDDCERCGLHSWNGKPLVSQEIHGARRKAHDAVDPLWREAPERAYEIEEEPGTEEYEEAVARIRGAMRNRVYHYLAERLGLPEPEVHMARQDDLRTLKRIRATALLATAEEIRAWWKEGREADEGA